MSKLPISVHCCSPEWGPGWHQSKTWLAAGPWPFPLPPVFLRALGLSSGTYGIIGFQSQQAFFISGREGGAFWPWLDLGCQSKPGAKAAFKDQWSLTFAGIHVLRPAIVSGFWGLFIFNLKNYIFLHINAFEMMQNSVKTTILIQSITLSPRALTTILPDISSYICIYLCKNNHMKFCGCAFYAQKIIQYKLWFFF